MSPVLRALCTSLNDGPPEGPRQRLRPYLSRTIGTAGDGLDETRGWMAMDWLIRTYAPRWLRLVSLDAVAAALADGPEITGGRSLQSAIESLERARATARRARGAAFTAEGNPITNWAARLALAAICTTRPG